MHPEYLLLSSSSGSHLNFSKVEGFCFLTTVKVLFIFCPHFSTIALSTINYFSSNLVHLVKGYGFSCGHMG